MNSSQWFRRAALLIALAIPSAALTVVRAQQPQGAGQTPAAPAGPLAPAVYKNIQVLTDVPADQLDLTMRFVSAAVGMPCLQCHVQDATTGEWAYDKDDKRSKQTARDMMKMVYAIRAGGVARTANCATCHNGKNRPPGLPLAEMMSPDQITAANAAAAARQGGPAGPPAGGAPGAAPGQRPAQPPPGPPVDEVLAKYIAALGGQANVDKLKSRVMSGTLTMRNGQTASFTIEEKGRKYRESQTPVTTGAAATAMSRGFDGAAAWTMAPLPADATGFVLQQIQRAAELTLPLTLKERYPALAPGRVTRVDGVDMNVLASNVNGVNDQFFFDTTSGLLVRHTTTTRTPMGSLPERVDYSDYKDVTGVKMPFTVKRINWSAYDTLKIVDVKPNAQIDDARFAKPKG